VFDRFVSRNPRFNGFFRDMQVGWIAAASAVAPPGGWIQRAKYMTPIARPTLSTWLLI
jgi:hypothetical protein